MHRFFAEPGQIGEKEIVITGADVNHIRNVLRMRADEEVLIADGQGAEYRCKLTDLGENEVRAQILWKLDGNAELASAITLFQGLPKSDKMDLIVQKCVELGVDRIVPVSTKRAVVKLDAKKEQTRLKRWNTISESAAKQSGRGVIPEVSGVMSFGKALEEAKKLDVLLIPYERAEHMAETRRVMGEIRPGQSVGIFIGPEGGFEESEVEEAVAAGAKAITLGKRILRTETAGLAVMAMLSYLLEE
ncbi:16S rRNA (uracil(1498)-N(3))-methyltransferase [Laedolimicola ammoniilytica]|uniref:Ribosomal RNA small subunit methyltransferase E n=1 Tax=Laedolimicola ammoniilytica TaxID=2981771 RepID=A0ABT2RVD6_9FIRM|nr:16S rRNA (uracil(1498)-N(3))-methyltransferase [Laedolimicola ammoniilytica]MCU6696132.1 16S rRNA (uracil(1498)-N(3))-methyltransferase [Laedolimicola ammoniilytica]SCH46211.1 Ribosomal RNA small subunit methyltransferase E [uncultured Clostridium sp.]